jgi:hypothetical protein
MAKRKGFLTVLFESALRDATRPKPPPARQPATPTVERRRTGALNLSASAVAALRPATLDPTWPALSPRPGLTDYLPRPDVVPLAERPFNRTTCPHCEAGLTPVPTAKKACPACAGVIYVRSGPEGKRHLLREGETPTPDQAWLDKREAAERSAHAQLEAAEAEYEAELARRGFRVGEWDLDVVGESFHHRELVTLVKALADGDMPHVAAELVREPTNPHDRRAVKVVIHGLDVGHLAREDAADYQPILKKMESQGRRAFVEAQLVGGRNWNDDSFGPIGVELMCVPEPLA